jgi:pimeloyl-ACP methyl ester carboxylesterase/hemerythrin-like domain-containing protein
MASPAPAPGPQAGGKPAVSAPAQAQDMTATPPFPLSTRTPSDPEPDLTALIVTHRAIRRDLARLADVLGQIAAGRAVPVRATAVCRYAKVLLAEISAHHRGEDDILWPVVATAAGQCVDLAPLADDHQAIEAAIREAGQILAAFAASPDAHRARLHASVSGLRDMLDEHIADEEAQIFPAARRYVPAPAYRRCERRIQRTIPAAARRFLLPWLARFAQPGELSRMLAAGGWPARFRLAATRPGYARLERRAFGPSSDTRKETQLNTMSNDAPRGSRDSQAGTTRTHPHPAGPPADVTAAAKDGSATRAERQIRAAEAALYARYGIAVQESFADMGSSGLRLRVLSAGAGPDVVLLHAFPLTSASWAPLLPALEGYRVHLVDLPGHGLSGPVRYRRGQARQAREDAVRLVDDLLAALGLRTAPIIGHSVGGMYALWHAAARPGTISRLILIAPGGALPGMRVRGPLRLLTLPVLGRVMLRAPAPRPAYRALIGRGMGSSLPAAPDELIDALRFSACQPHSAASVASLLRTLDRFGAPDPATVMTGGELAQVSVPALFLWGRGDPYLAPAAARPWVAKIPGAVLDELPGGHAPWLDDPASCARPIADFLRACGTGPA